jgi:hypothetical protein
MRQFITGHPLLIRNYKGCKGTGLASPKNLDKIEAGSYNHQWSEKLTILNHEESWGFDCRRTEAFIICPGPHQHIVQRQIPFWRYTGDRAFPPRTNSRRRNREPGSSEAVSSASLVSSCPILAPVSDSNSLRLHLPKKLHQRATNEVQRKEEPAPKVSLRAFAANLLREFWCYWMCHRSQFLLSLSRRSTI